MTSVFNRIVALGVLLSLGYSAAALAEPSLSISVSPTDLTLVGGDSQIEKITAYGTGPVLVGPSDDQCDKSRLVNVLGGKSEHQGGALVTSSTYTLFLQAKREAGECTITFAVDTLGHGSVQQIARVRVLPEPTVSITVSPDKLQSGLVESASQTYRYRSRHVERRPADQHLRRGNADCLNHQQQPDEQRRTGFPQRNGNARCVGKTSRRLHDDVLGE